VLQCAAVCRIVLQRAAVCCIVLQCGSVVQCVACVACVAMCCSVLQFVAVCCKVLQNAAVCCIVMKCVALNKKKIQKKDWKTMRTRSHLQWPDSRRCALALAVCPPHLEKDLSSHLPLRGPRPLTPPACMCMCIYIRVHVNICITYEQ